MYFDAASESAEFPLHYLQMTFKESDGNEDCTADMFTDSDTWYPNINDEGELIDGYYGNTTGVFLNDAVNTASMTSTSGEIDTLRAVSGFRVPISPDDDEDIDFDAPVCFNIRIYQANATQLGPVVLDETVGYLDFLNSNCNDSSIANCNNCYEPGREPFVNSEGYAQYPCNWQGLCMVDTGLCAYCDAPYTGPYCTEVFTPTILEVRPKFLGIGDEGEEITVFGGEDAWWDDYEPPLCRFSKGENSIDVEGDYIAGDRVQLPVPTEEWMTGDVQVACSNDAGRNFGEGDGYVAIVTFSDSPIVDGFTGIWDDLGLAGQVIVAATLGLCLCVCLAFCCVCWVARSVEKGNIKQDSQLARASAFGAGLMPERMTKQFRLNVLVQEPFYVSSSRSKTKGGGHSSSRSRRSRDSRRSHDSRRSRDSGRSKGSRSGGSRSGGSRSKGSRKDSRGRSGSKSSKGSRHRSGSKSSKSSKRSRGSRNKSRMTASERGMASQSTSGFYAEP